MTNSRQTNINLLWIHGSNFLHINVSFEKQKQCQNAIFKDSSLQLNDFSCTFNGSEFLRLNSSMLRTL